MLNKLSKKSQTQNIFEVESEKVEMTLNTESTLASGLLIQRLTELYEDPIVAVVRETVSNALDANAESNKESKIIKIETPTILNPIFSVQDNGVGMSYEDLVNVYSKYGASTKQNNFNQVGAYGLGAKSPLAYTNQFTVSSVKNGEKTTVLIVREEMTNFMKVVENQSTSEESGTKISVPVNSNDIERFSQTAALYRETPIDYNSKIYLNDEEIVDKFSLISSNLRLAESGNGEFINGRIWIKDTIRDKRNLLNIEEYEISSSILFVIGGWIYKPTTHKRSRFYSTNPILYVELKPGLLSFNSSRDKVIENERLEELFNNIKKSFLGKEMKMDIFDKIKSYSQPLFKETILESINAINGILSLKDKKPCVNSTNIQFNQELFENENKDGYSIGSIIKDTFSKKSIVFSVDNRKPSFNNSSLCFYTSEIKDGVYFNNYNQTSFQRMKKEFSKVFSEITPYLDYSYFRSLTSTINRMNFSHHLDNSQKHQKLIVISFEELNQKSVEKLISKRNMILKEIYELEDACFILTEENLSDVKKYFSDIKEENVEILDEKTLFTSISLEEKRKRKERSNVPVEVELSNTLLKYNADKNENESIYPPFDFKGSKVIVVLSDLQIQPDLCLMYKNWYCNLNQLNPKDLVLLQYVGLVKMKEIPLLEKVGEIFVSHSSGPLSNAKSFEYNNKKIFGHFTVDSDKVEKNHIMKKLIMAASRVYNNEIGCFERTTSYLRLSEEFAEDLNLKKIEKRVNEINRSFNANNKTFKSIGTLSKESLTHAFSYLTSDDRKLLFIIINMVQAGDYYKNTFVFDEEGNHSYINEAPNFIPTSEEIKSLKLQEVQNSMYGSFIKTKIESFKKLIEDLCKNI